ncbi:hypothetical protein [Longimicrobium terrae]|uniref:Putative DNA-binding ribbon-helix-helix protein n=1 Tax=Longimicrobium terrae TaxID=1639882 RepID=A0A841GQ79_9BACT|nr:hypothetical protein [Longimicrobium terrae]MBB4635198.1 putative DNA-binding ribbon-helix-helix protein [Longimicrobium terrae]MBB6069592.1 putative DNA-binding ribbon-helix-helix protein [Longimicrobium terrae]NNC31606.1 hypothetical protein [Longimicrobium terrae]
MSSPLEKHEVRLRGLRRTVRRGSMDSVRPPAQERMNSPLEKHEVRLRGLRRMVRCGSLDPVRRQILPWRPILV